MLLSYAAKDELGMGLFQRRILLAAGLCFAADAMEILLLSFLAVCLKAEWNLSEDQTSTITGSVFWGAMIGTLVLGPLGDRVGRKPVFTAAAGIIAAFGFLTAAASMFPVLVAIRFLCGFGIGGLTVPFDCLAEFVPTSARGTNLLAIEYFWCIGTLLTPVAAYYTIGVGGEEGTDVHAWRWFVVLCAIPCLLSTVVGIIWVPESPRWLLSVGKHDEALAILRQAAACNGKDPDVLFPQGTRLVSDDEEANGEGPKGEDSANCAELLSPKWRRTTIFLWMVWCGFGFIYYGTIIAVTTLFSSTSEDIGDQNGNGYEKTLYSFDYGAIFASASSEIAGLSLVILTIDRCGRILTQALTYAFGGISIFALCMLASPSGGDEVDGVSRTTLIAAAFLARMLFMGAGGFSRPPLLFAQLRTRTNLEEGIGIDPCC